MSILNLVVCLLIGLAGPAGGRAFAGEMSRAEKERFLKTARVVSVEEVGEGATRPLKVVLDDGTVRMKAIFKSIDLRMKITSRFGAETVEGYADSYRHEVAAYELNKLLGLHVVPVTVERKIDGKRGSLQAWVSHLMPHYGHGEALPDLDRAQDEIHAVWLFDYLIYNLDRRTHNLMLAADWRPVLVDHSMTFSTFQRPFRPLYRFPREVVGRLRALDDKTLRNAMKRYMKGDQVRAFLKRRETVLKMVDRLVAERGEAAVLYSFGR